MRDHGALAQGRRIRESSMPIDWRRSRGAWAGLIGPAAFIGVLTIEGWKRLATFSRWT